MKVIAANQPAFVLEPIYCAVTEKYVEYSALPVIAWLVGDIEIPIPITCMGKPEGLFLVKFDESVDPSGAVYNPRTNSSTLHPEKDMFVAKQRILGIFEKMAAAL